MRRFPTIITVALGVAFHGLLGLAVLGLGSIATGCATSGRAADETSVIALAASRDAAPEDLTIDVSVLTGVDAPIRYEAHQRPGRFVLFPDGSLHADVHAEDRSLIDARPIVSQRLPPRVRVLSRRDVESLWTEIVSWGFADASRRRAPDNIASIEPPRDGVTYVVSITAEHDRWFVVPEPGDGSARDAAVALVRRLAELGWVSDFAARRVRVIPRRYDLGPDPHARYRGR